MSYCIARGEMGVLTFEPYKSEILPFWRFKTPAIAEKSSAEIYAKFLAYYEKDDFIGMDMSRKFLQMGMTRAKRYANHKGGRKYDKVTRRELVRDEEFEGRAEKLESSMIFKEFLEKAKSHGGYQAKKERFQKEQKEWNKAQKGDSAKMDSEVEEEDLQPKLKRQRQRQAKTETRNKEEEKE